MHVPWYVNSATQGGSSTCHLSFQDCFRHQAGYKSSGTEVLQTTSWDFLGWLTHTHPPPLTIQVNILVFLIGKENEERGWAKMIMSVSRKANQLTGVSSWRTRNMHKNQDLRQGMPKKWQPGANYWEMNQKSHHELWRGFDLQLDLDLAAKGYMSVEETRCTFQQLQMLELFFPVSMQTHANPSSSGEHPTLQTDRHFIAHTSRVQYGAIHMCSETTTYVLVFSSTGKHKIISTTPPSFPNFTFPAKLLLEIIKPLICDICFFSSMDLILLTISNASMPLYTISLAFLMPPVPSKWLSILIFINAGFFALLKLFFKRY